MTWTRKKKKIVTQNQKLLKTFIFLLKKDILKVFIVHQKQKFLFFLYFMEQSGTINKNFKKSYSYTKTEIFEMFLDIYLKKIFIVKNIGQFLLFHIVE